MRCAARFTNSAHNQQKLAMPFALQLSYATTNVKKLRVGKI